MLEIFETPPSSAKENMEMDETLLKELHLRDMPILHLYEWKRDSITYGYFIQPKKIFNLKKIEEHTFDIARRATGGGVVFHSSDYAFSFLLPATSPHFSLNTLENYQFVNTIVLRAVQMVTEKNDLHLIQEDVPLTHMQMKNFCMARPTKYDVLLHRRKVAGAAQRKTKSGYLHQGTISVALPKQEVVRDVLLNEGIYKAMEDTSFSLLKENWTKDQLRDVREQMKSALIQSFNREFSKS